jgi:hypothetical protein
VIICVIRDGRDRAGIVFEDRTCRVRLDRWTRADTDTESVERKLACALGTAEVRGMFIACSATDPIGERACYWQ